MNRPGRRQRTVFLGAATLAVLIAGGYLCFELGRYEAGYSLLDQHRERDVQAQRLAERDETIEELRRQIAVLETSREIDRETYARVEADLSQLQARIQAQEEELAFYRGIVSPQDGAAGLRIQNLEILPADSEQRYLMRLVLVQGIVHDRRVSGVVKLQVAGSQDGQPALLDLTELLEDDEGAELAYRFRYFQGFERELVLPVGFQPDKIEVEIWPREPRGDPITQSFQWSAVRG